MSYGGFPEKADEERILSQIETNTANRQNYSAQATPELATRIGEIYRTNPWMKPGEILALAKAGASDQLVNAAGTQSAKMATTRANPITPTKKNWFQRNIYEPAKAGSRYAFAALNLAPELTQNATSQLLNSNNPEGFDDFFQSTSLGVLLASSKGEIDPATGQRITAGEGFFVGGTAAEKQSELARQVRGTINGNAWTLGRGAADVVSSPGTKPYNFLSGIVDASLNIFADPTLFGGKAIAASRTARAAIPALQSADEIAAFAKVAATGEYAAAGLSQAETVAWNGSKFRAWFQTNGKARRLTETLVEKDDGYDIFSNVFKGKIDINSANRLAKAKSSEEILAIVGEQANRMDSELSGLFPTDIRDIVKGRERIPFWNNLRNSELITKTPDLVITAGDSRQSMKAVTAYGNYLKTIGLNVAEGEGKEFMVKAMEIYADPTAAGSTGLNELFETLVKKVVSNELGDGAFGIAKEQADEIGNQLFVKVAQLRDELKNFLMNEAGELDDFGLMQALKDSGHLIVGDDVNPASIKNLRLAGPGSLVELADKVHILPDIRAVRRLTANPFVRRAISKKSGDARGATVLADYLQNEIWKPLTLMTGGYIFRNMFDAQIRMAAVGKAGFFNHPFRYMQLVLNKTLPEAFVGRGALDDSAAAVAKPRTVTKAEVDTALASSGLTDTPANRKLIRGGLREATKTQADGVEEIVRNFDGYTSNFEEALSFGLRRNIDDPQKTYERGIRNGSMIVVNKTRDKPQYLRGLYDEIRRLSQDQVNNAVAKGIPTDEIVKFLRNSNDPKAVAALKAFTRYLQGGLDTIDATTGKHHLVRVSSGEISDDVLATFINRLGDPRIASVTGNDETLRFAIAHRKMPLATSETINPNNIGDLDFFEGSLRQGVGSVVRMGQEAGEPILAVVTSVNGPTSWTVRRLSNFDVWDTREGAKELNNYLLSVYDTPGNTLPRFVKFAQEVGVPSPAGATPRDKEFLALKNRAVDFFFDRAYGGLSRKFERSPVYRQFYYQNFLDNADLLTAEQATFFRQSIAGRAEYLGMTPEQIFGGKKQYEELLAKLDSANGTGTVKQLEDYAGIRALQSTKETLYNATERSNLEDIMRIIVPFGSAWREILGTYGKILYEDPSKIRRAQLIYNGSVNFDPDNDGQGFFYKDPITGQNTFNIPFTGDLAKLITGVNAPLQAPVKGLSMGLQVIPAIGPVAQILASELIPDTPSTDEIVEILLPYGRKKPGAVIPGYLNKLYSALRDNPGKTESIFGNTYGEVVRAMASSGEYSLEDPAEKERLLNDAKWRARVLTGFRAVSQFLGPTSGTPEAIVETDKGDVYASYLLKAFQDLQTENYDTAIKRFFDIYGDDALLYVSSKTQAVQPGIAATEQFGDWERSNKDVMEAFPLVASYFAPGGDDFSFSVWERQIRTGSRKRLTASEMIDLAQYRVGSALYRDLKRQAGQFPNAEIRQWLSLQREKINKKFPGFPAKAVFTINEFSRNIEEMKRAVADPRLADNSAAKATAEYLGYRDKAIAQYVASGGAAGGFATAKGANDLRQWLFNIGTALAEAEPDFQRVFDRELGSEVDEL